MPFHYSKDLLSGKIQSVNIRNRIAFIVMALIRESDCEVLFVQILYSHYSNLVLEVGGQFAITNCVGAGCGMPIQCGGGGSHGHIGVENHKEAIIDVD